MTKKEVFVGVAWILGFFLFIWLCVMALPPIVHWSKEWSAYWENK